MGGLGCRLTTGEGGVLLAFGRGGWRGEGLEKRGWYLPCLLRLRGRELLRRSRRVRWIV